LFQARIMPAGVICPEGDQHDFFVELYAECARQVGAQQMPNSPLRNASSEPALILLESSVIAVPAPDRCRAPSRLHALTERQHPCPAT